MSSVRPVDLALNEGLDRQRQLAQALLDCQQQLREAMRSGQSERIERETQHQAGLLPGLDSGRQALRELLASGGFEDGAAGVHAVLESANRAARESLSQRWEELRGQLREIRENNRRNAVLANSHGKAILDSLMQITGHGRQAGAGYGRDGHSDVGPRSRVIARA